MEDSRPMGQDDLPSWNVMDVELMTDYGRSLLPAIAKCDGQKDSP